MHGDETDVSGIGGTLAGNPLSSAAMRATLSTCLRPEDFAVSEPLAQRWTDGVAEAIAESGLPWSVQRLGCRAEYWFCPPPRTGAGAAAAADHELDAFMHLHALNRGVLLTPFHNMALMAPAHTNADVDLPGVPEAVALLRGERLSGDDEACAHSVVCAAELNDLELFAVDAFRAKK
jgi:glutamate-1-semialdehyde 2,1-aminomutase